MLGRRILSLVPGNLGITGLLSGRRRCGWGLRNSAARRAGGRGARTRCSGERLPAARFAAARGLTILFTGFLTGLFRLVVRLVGGGIALSFTAVKQNPPSPKR